MGTKHRKITLGLASKLFLAMLFLNLVTSIAFTIYTYESEQRSILRGVDDKLLASAEGIRVVGSGYHDRWGREKAITPAAYNAFIDTLSDFAAKAKVEYFYTIVKQGDRILFTSSSYTPDEKASGDLTQFLDPYDDASDGLKAAFADRQTHFDQYSDQWGTFRSIFLPARSSAGVDYVIGVDVSMAGIDEILRATLLKCLLIASAVFSAGLIALWIMTRRMIANPLLRVIGVFERIGRGDYGNRIDRDRADEIGALFRALAAMQENLSERSTAEKRTSEAMRRVTSALDQASTSMMVADAAGTIIYLNSACTRLMTEGAADLRQVIPTFDAANLIGRNFSEFHRNPTRQRDLLADLDKTHTTEVHMGERTFNMTINPVRDERGERLGTVLEWLDRTAEVAAERELDGLLKGATQGDFSQRLSLDGKEGFFRELAAGMNELTALVARVLDDLAGALKALARGDLSHRIEASYEGRFAELKEDTNETADHLRQLVGQIQEASRTIQSAAQEMACGNADLSARTEEQASNLEQASSALEEFNASVRQNAENARSASDLAQRADSQAGTGGQLVRQVVANMEAIQTSSHSMADIIAVIDGIAFQTNILALNAAVEAARAGEQGRGFAVVAGEVRALAQRSAQAAQEIKRLIGDSLAKVDDGARLVEAAGSTMDSIVSSFRQVVELVGEIAAASHEQDAGIRQVSQAVTRLDEMTQRNAALVEEASAGAESLADQAVELSRAVASFQISGGGEDRREKGKAAPPVPARRTQRHAG